MKGALQLCKVRSDLVELLEGLWIFSQGSIPGFTRTALGHFGKLLHARVLGRNYTMLRALESCLCSCVSEGSMGSGLRVPIRFLVSCARLFRAFKVLQVFGIKVPF